MPGKTSVNIDAATERLSREERQADVINAAVANGVMGLGASSENHWTSTRRPGLIFTLKRFSRIVLMDALNRMKPPKVPVTWIEDKERAEPNPNDPEYVEALSDHHTERGVIAINTYLVLGTELDKLPSNMQAVDDDEWCAPLSMLGLTVVPTSDKYHRYVQWVRWYAVDEDELMELQRACRRFNGDTLEADVEAAQDELKSVSAGSADTGTSAQTEN